MAFVKDRDRKLKYLALATNIDEKEILNSIEKWFSGLRLTTFEKLKEMCVKKSAKSL